MLRIKLVKSLIGQKPRNRATVAALGLRKMHSVVLKDDTPAIRGMIHHVKHMLTVEEVEGQAPAKRANKVGKKAEAPAKAAPKKAAAKAEAPAEAAVAEAPTAEAPAKEAKPKAAKPAAKAPAKAKPKTEDAPAEKPKRTTKAKKTEE